MSVEVEAVRRLEKHMYGNGRDGVLVRLDRLEQRSLAWKDRIAIWIGPIVVAVLSAVFHKYIK